MTNRLTVDLGTVAARRLEQASTLMRFPDGNDIVAVVLDAASGRFVRVPSPASGDALVVALAPDGRTVLFRASRDEDGRRTLCLVTLAAGERRWFDPSEDHDFDVTAAMSPNGHTIATITTGDDPAHPDAFNASAVAVDLIDVTTGRRRRLWSTPGETGDSAVSWSPDGRLIAASFLTMDEQYATVVIDVEAESTRRYGGAQIPFASNGAWLGDREFVCFTHHGAFAAHLDHGNRPLPLSLRLEDHGLPMAFAGDRIIWVAPVRSTESADVVTTNLDGSNPQALITTRPARTITLVDIAPNAATS